MDKNQNQPNPADRTQIGDNQAQPQSPNAPGENPTTDPSSGDFNREEEERIFRENTELDPNRILDLERKNPYTPSDPEPARDPEVNPPFGKVDPNPQPK